MERRALLTGTIAACLLPELALAEPAPRMGIDELFRVLGTRFKMVFDMNTKFPAVSISHIGEIKDHRRRAPNYDTAEKALVEHILRYTSDFPDGSTLYWIERPGVSYETMTDFDGFSNWAVVGYVGFSRFAIGT